MSKRTQPAPVAGYSSRRPGKLGAAQPTYRGVSVDFILWIIAVVLVLSGIFAIFRGELIWGIVLIIIGLLVGPGGVSIFHTHHHH
jgi:hypothetical protein